MGALLTVSTDEPVNITKQVRMKSNFSLQSFADFAEVSPQIVLRTDQGVYPTIPPAIHNAILELAPITSTELHTEYDAYIRSHRLWAQRIKPLDSSKLFTPNYIASPLVKWRTLCGYDSRMSFCTAFCLHSSTIARFESGQAKHVPESLFTLFDEIYDLDTAVGVKGELTKQFHDWLNKNLAA